MQQWRIIIEYFPGSMLDRDRWHWQMVEYGELVESSYASDADQACEDIAYSLRKFSDDS